MAALDEIGLCPLCDGEGTVGEPCGSKPCRKRGYRFVPRAHLPKDGVPDPMVGRMIDDYLVAEVLGAGGFGKVYLALQMPIRLRAALKLLHRDARDPAVARAMVQKFFGEAQALAALAHPNIVRLLKYGVHEDGPYLVMEYVAGARTLKDEVGERAARGEHLDAGTARHILRQIIDGLDAAHQLHIIHRDIKPENVMLQAVAGNAHFVRVVDFGLAKFVAERTETSMAMGTPVYMAPEQLLRRHIGPWTDLYAVGVIAYELMTGRRPFGGGTVEQIVAAKLDAGFDPLHAIADIDVPAAAARFFKKALARDTGDRYPDASAFRQDLDRAFDAAENEHVAPMESVDLTGLVDASERVRLAREQQQLAAERRALAAERVALARERQALEDAIRRSTEPDVRVPAPPAPTPPPAAAPTPGPPPTAATAPEPPQAHDDDDDEDEVTVAVSPDELASATVPARARADSRDDPAAAPVEPVVTDRVDDEVLVPRRQRRRWPLGLAALGVAGAIAAAVAVATSGPAADIGGSSVGGGPTAVPSETSEATRGGVPEAVDPAREEAARREAAARADEEACAAADRAGSPEAWRQAVEAHPDAPCAPAARERLALWSMEPRPRLDAIARGLDPAATPPSLLEPPALLALATEALRVLAPEAKWPVERVIGLDPDLLSAERTDEIPLEAPPRTVLLVPPGRFVLQQGLRLRGARQVALLAGPDREIFARSGQAVMAVTDSEDVLLWGLYLNHHEVDVDGYRVDRDDCIYAQYHPRIKSSDVLDILDSKRVSVRRSDLEGTGFIGVKLVRSQDVLIADTVIHDCISAGIHLEGSQPVLAQNVLLYRIGARAFRMKYTCLPLVGADCKGSDAIKYGYPAFAATFKTAVFVDAGSALTLSRATVVVPEPLARSQAFEVEGRLVVEESLIAQRAGLLQVAGNNALVSVIRTCTNAPESSAKRARLDQSRFGVDMNYPAANDDVSFRNAPEIAAAPECADYGADVGRDGIPRHLKPEPREPATP